MDEHKATFRFGQTVEFGRPNGMKHRGNVEKVNSTTVSIITGEGKRYRVHPSFVRDVDIVDQHDMRLARQDACK